MHELLAGDRQSSRYNNIVELNTMTMTMRMMIGTFPALPPELRQTMRQAHRRRARSVYVEKQHRQR